MTTPNVLPDGFVYVSDFLYDGLFDIRYATTYNFTGSRIDGYYAQKPILTHTAAVALTAAAEEFRRHGFRIVIYDAYRPQKAVAHFLRWINDPTDPGLKHFYPNITKERLLAEGYIDAHSSHSRGSVVDMTLAHPNGELLEMGGEFDLFDVVSNPAHTKITGEEYSNRQMLREVMTASGFTPIRSEWWHFKLANEPFPETYFDFDVK